MTARLIQFLSGELPLPTREICREYAVERFDWKHIAPQVQDSLLAPK
jgi:hypothetical protein